MGVKVVGTKSRPVDKVVTCRFTPIMLKQVDYLQDYMGETMSRVFMRAIDMLYNNTLENEKISKLKNRVR